MKNIVKKYYATSDNGHEFVGIMFYSLYRANSRQNRIDAIRAYAEKHGMHYLYRIPLENIKTVRIGNNDEWF